MHVTYAETRERDERVAVLLGMEKRVRAYGYPDFADEILEEVSYIRAGEYDDCLNALDKMIAHGNFILGQITAHSDRDFEGKVTLLKANLASKKAREWTDEDCERAARKFINGVQAEPHIKTGLLICEATDLKNSTQAKQYIVRGLELLKCRGALSTEEAFRRIR